jgi:hypothetical protein
MCFKWQYGVVVFRKDVRGHQLPTTFVLLSAYIFMFNKTILLFHLFLPLLSLFLSILMQYVVNSNLHVSTLYTLIIPTARELKNLKIVQLQASGTFNASSFHYVNCTRTSFNTSTRTFSSLFLFYDTIAQFSNIWRFYNRFWVVHYRFSLLF